jgi:hypothetical protein
MTLSIANRFAGLATAAVAAPVAIGAATLVTSSVPLAAAGLGAAATLGALFHPRQAAPVFLVRSILAGLQGFSNYASAYGAMVLSKALLANPSQAPALAQRLMTLIKPMARFYAFVGPFAMTLAAALTALKLASLAGAGTRAFLLGA